MNPTRRHWLVSSATAIACTLVNRPSYAADLLLTPSQSTGPYYPLELPLDSDNDLVQVNGKTGIAAGEISNVVGRVMDQRGVPIRDVTVEIWQCNAYGRYHHPGDERARLDSNFQGYGQTKTDHLGGYRFRTIKPVGYPGRAPHIHFAINPRQGARLITQMYVKGEPRNAHDGPLGRVRSREARDSLIVAFEPAPNTTGELIARFDIVISGIAVES